MTPITVEVVVYRSPLLCWRGDWYIWAFDTKLCSNFAVGVQSLVS